MTPPPIPRKQAPRTPAKKPGTPGSVTLSHMLDLGAKAAAAGKIEEALKTLQHAVDKFPTDKGKVPTLAELLMQSAARLRAQHPAAAASLAKEAVKRDPELTGGWIMLSGLFDRLGDLKEAKQAAIKVVESPKALPDQVLAASNLLVRYKEDKLAIESARKAYEDLGRPLAWTSAILYIAQKVADFPLIDELTAQLRKGHEEGRSLEARESPRTNLLWCDSETMNVDVVKAWTVQAIPGEIAVPPPATSLEGRRLKVGYLSSDFRDHPTSRLINGLLRNHDRTKYEVSLYDSGWDDGSDMRKEVVSHVDHVHSVAALSDEQAAALIRGHGIDVLVELNGPTRANRMSILRYRPAPVQIDYLGWPGSVGGRVVDYVVGDGYCVPEGVEALYPEKLIRLHKTYQVNDYAAQKRPEVPTRAKLGLPEGVPVIGMFNAINKVHTEVWATWMKIMRAVPDSVLWLLDPGPVARRNIAKYCATAGVNPKRILAAPALKQDAHIARLGACDIMVDPWPYGGHTSTSDALFAGVPVVAVAGTNFPSRVSGGLLKAAGMEALVQPTLEGYVRTAVKLLRDPKELRRIKDFITENIAKTDIFDARAKARQLEAAYRDAYQRVLDGKPPRHMTFRPPEKGAGGRARATEIPAKEAPATVARATPAPTPVSASAVSTSTAPAKAASSNVATMPLSRATAPEAASARLPVVLVVGPWSSGTSAVAGLLAKAGLYAPGPYVAVNDPKTPWTYEMKAFQQALKQLASETTLKRTAAAPEIVQSLRDFRDKTLRKPWEEAGGAAVGPIMLKHALTALMLPELCEVFDVRIVSVLRSLDAIEATRLRRSWFPAMGADGARTVYRNVFEFIVGSETPFQMVRYPDMIAKPQETLDSLARFCGLELEEARRAEALAFVSRPRADAVPAAVAVQA